MVILLEIKICVVQSLYKFCHVRTLVHAYGTCAFYLNHCEYIDVGVTVHCWVSSQRHRFKITHFNCLMRSDQPRWPHFQYAIYIFHNRPQLSQDTLWSILFSNAHYTLPRHCHPNKPKSINSKCQKNLCPSHAPPNHSLNTIMPKRHRQAHHPRIVPALLALIMPRTIVKNCAEEEPGAQRACGEVCELRLVSGCVVLTNLGRVEVEGEVAEDTDDGGLGGNISLGTGTVDEDYVR